MSAVDEMGERLLTSDELAAFLHVPCRTVDQWRNARRGPRYIKCGKHVRYRPADVEEWLTAQTVTPGASA